MCFGIFQTKILLAIERHKSCLLKNQVPACYLSDSVTKLSLFLFGELVAGVKFEEKEKIPSATSLKHSIIRKRVRIFHRAKVSAANNGKIDFYYSIKPWDTCLYLCHIFDNSIGDGGGCRRPPRTPSEKKGLKIKNRCVPMCLHVFCIAKKQHRRHVWTLFIDDFGRFSRGGI